MKELFLTTITKSPEVIANKFFCLCVCFFHTITYKYVLTQKKLYKKTDAIFSIYGKNGINPWHFFWILT